MGRATIKLVQSHSGTIGRYVPDVANGSNERK